MKTLTLRKRTDVSMLRPMALLGALALSAALIGCGGGGGGGGTPSAPSTLTGQPTGNTLSSTGQAAFTVVFPPSGSLRSASGFTREANALPPEAQKVEVQLFAVTAGVRASQPTESKTMDRPGANGGSVSVRFVVREGRYIVVIKSFDATGKVLGASTEPVSVKAGATTSVPTTLGIMYTDTGFSPTALTLKTGERLMVHHDGTAMGEFHLGSVGDCRATVARTGSLACTVRQQGTFTLSSPGGTHTAEITVQQDDAMLATAKPSLGTLRSEGVADGGTFAIRFLINNGGQPVPTGTVLNPGNNAPAQAVTSTSVTVNYAPGSYVAELKSATGTVLAQRYVAVYAPQATKPTNQVILANLPSQVSSSTLAVSGSTSPALVSGKVVIEVGSREFHATTTATGTFSTSVQLTAGANTLVAYVINTDGVAGPKAQATVTFVPGGTPGQVSFIEIGNLPQTLTVGEQTTFTATGFDSLGSVVSFSPVLTAQGFDIQVNGPTSFTPITTGTGKIIVTAPNGVSVSVQVTVEASSLVQVVVSPGNLTARVGQPLQFTVFGTDALGNVLSTVNGATFSGTDILSGVDTTGSVTPTQSGYGVITVTTPGGLTAQACVTVNPTNPPPTRTAANP